MMSMTVVKEIPIDKIIIPETRARATFTEEQHQELMASIKNYGFTVPILVPVSYTHLTLPTTERV